MTLPLNFRGRDYPSIRAAALDHGLCVTSLWRAVQQGAPNMAGKQPRRSKPIPVTINGIEYQSFTAAAAALGYDKTTIASYARRLGYNFRIGPKSKAEAA